MSSDENQPRRDFSAFYQATLAPLRRYLARFLRNDAEAEEIAHDAYLRIYPGMAEGRARRPEGLLYTTARRLALNRLKRRKISPIAGNTDRPDAIVAPGPGVAEQVAARADWTRLEAALAALPPGCRAVLLLRKIELLSHQEIADRLGIAVSTVEKQHARALRLLREALTDQPVTGSRPASTQEVQP